jgi:hypothetical protein
MTADGNRTLQRSLQATVICRRPCYDRPYVGGIVTHSPSQISRVPAIATPVRLGEMARTAAIPFQETVANTDAMTTRCILCRR